MINDNVYRVTTKEHLEHACARLAAMQAPLLPAFRAAADGVIELAVIGDPQTAWPDKLLAQCRKPCLVIVSDDPDPPNPASVGPAGWRCMRRIRYWAKVAVVHGAAGEPGHYRAAVAMAVVTGRAVIIETASCRAQAWADALKPVPGMVIVPPPATSHPVEPVQEVRH